MTITAGRAGTSEPGPVIAELERVVANLVGNAARHTLPGQKVLVTVGVLAGRVELRVVDRGPGLPADGRERLFEPFQRLGDTDNTTGLGLGLALARGLTEAMDGTLIPEDTPGGGLTMVVSLPCAELEREQAGTTDPDPVVRGVTPVPHQRRSWSGCGWGRLMQTSAARSSPTPCGGRRTRSSADCASACCEGGGDGAVRVPSKVRGPP